MMARLELTPAPRAFMPPGVALLERETGRADVLPFMRSGPNANTTATARFKTRNGSALKGQHFDFPAEGEVQFAAGISRVEIPVTVYNNSISETDRSFFIDLVNESGAVLSTSEIRIRNDDPGIEILGIENNRLKMRAIGGEPYHDFDWMVSSDLANWESGYITYTGSEVEIDLSGGHRFIDGAPAPAGYGGSPWESHVFIYR